MRDSVSVTGTLSSVAQWIAEVREPSHHGALPPEGSTRAEILPGCPSLDRGNQETDVRFEPRPVSKFALQLLSHLIPRFCRDAFNMIPKEYKNAMGFRICALIRRHVWNPTRIPFYRSHSVAATAARKIGQEFGTLGGPASSRDLIGRKSGPNGQS
ncbi:hypothetical protein T265_04468 [Opisthorchis viverrini]|uniref:Uncharacterized protein n=1 Tax=Opisthorchis viverrini TaxID=6198 RepID=A0A074ZN13_OPIVI|nr:hypothetical protein T265_04468 [Opisthorchis viverrini]KER28778.1 hypothetical protein T265_04468 [Opisthorchis viverrini]